MRKIALAAATTLMTLICLPAFAEEQDAISFSGGLMAGKVDEATFVATNTKLVNQGHAGAMIELGIYYEVFPKKSSKPDKGISLYRQAAKLGNGYAMSNLCDRPKKAPLKERIEFCRKAATGVKSEIAQRHMATLYFDKSIPTANSDEMLRLGTMWAVAAYKNGDERIRPLVDGLRERAPDIVAKAEEDAAPYLQ